MDQVDIGLFDYDRNNTLYFFILNADEQIYSRYGGRDSKSPDTYLSLASLEIALKNGLDLHRRSQQGELKAPERPKPLFPREIPLLVERTFARNACVECHLIGDFQNLQRERDGKLDKLTHLYRSPDIKTLGIQLDVPQGLVVKETQGAAQTAGIKPLDRIVALNSTAVWTFGDLQYQYDKVDRRAERIRITVDRNSEPVELTVDLPVRWWWTDLRFRQSSVEPRPYFEDRPLTEQEKRTHRLKPEGFASEVKYVGDFAKLMMSHDLKIGDIIFAVDGVETDELVNSAEMFIKLRRSPEQKVALSVIRDGKRMEMPLKTFRMSFRK